jgi:hypothetical protein
VWQSARVVPYPDGYNYWAVRMGAFKVEPNSKGDKEVRHVCIMWWLLSSPPPHAHRLMLTALCSPCLLHMCREV